MARDGSVVHLSSAPLLFEALDKFLQPQRATPTFKSRS
jgi:hypothetical protein